MNIYSVAIVGVTGYAGRELDHLLSRHPGIRVRGRFASTSDAASGVEEFTLDKVRACAADIVVLATEHEFSMENVPALLDRGCRVLDMSGAFRLKDPALYDEWYGFTHTSTALLNTALYGLPEVFRRAI